MGDFWELIASLGTDERVPSAQIQPPDPHYINIEKMLDKLQKINFENSRLFSKWMHARQKLVNCIQIEKKKEQEQRDFSRAIMEKTKENKQQIESLQLILEVEQLRTKQLLLDLREIHQIEQWSLDEDDAFMKSYQIGNEIEEMRSLKMVIGIPEKPEDELKCDQFDCAILQLYNDYELLTKQMQYNEQHKRLLKQQTLVRQEKLDSVKEELRLKLLDHYKQCIRELQPPETSDWSSCSSRGSDTQW